MRRVEIICGVFCVSRQSELSVKLNRQLERCLRNSKCIDTESLCVVSGEKVIHTHTTDTHKTIALSIDDDDDGGGGVCLRVSRCGRSGWMFTH